MGTSSARINIDIQALDILSAGVAAGVIPAKFLVQTDLNTGVSDGQCDLMFAKTESAIAASLITSYDLAGSLKDSFGNTLFNISYSKISFWR